MGESAEKLSPDAIRFLGPIISSLTEKIIISSSPFSVARGLTKTLFKSKNKKDALSSGILLEVENQELIIRVALQITSAEQIIQKAEKLQEMIMSEISLLTGSKVKEVRLFIRNFSTTSKFSNEKKTKDA